MGDIHYNEWNEVKDTLVHPYYNDGYDRYDLSVQDIVQGLKSAGYDLDGENDGNWWEDDNLSEIVNYRLEILTDNGTILDSETYSTKLTAKLYMNNKDITSTIPDINFKWSRISGNTEINKLEDAEWNLRFAQGAKEILVTKQDVNRKALFQCQFVKYHDEVEWVQDAYNNYVKLINEKEVNK